MENLPTVVQEWCNTRAHTHTRGGGGEWGAHRVAGTYMAHFYACHVRV